MIINGLFCHKYILAVTNEARLCGYSFGGGVEGAQDGGRVCRIEDSAVRCALCSVPWTWDSA